MAALKSPPIHFHFLQSFALADRRKLKSFIVNIFKKEGGKLGELNYIFCSDDYLLGINQQYLKHDFYTDIITFNLGVKGEPIAGEIYISVDRVKENAKTLGTSFRSEMLRVIFHGVLHLSGYKDKSKTQEKEMRAREDYYLKRLGA